jgi:hypothetical protein
VKRSAAALAIEGVRGVRPHGTAGGQAGQTQHELSARQHFPWEAVLEE